uniref:Uncharacterized protein n=1 Tax=Coccidioides posadasii RMSCC 3488 TaxID=454284 RepID=A0A0J6FIW0_COCPO|nr:hypothetical protein CPAG_05093 [Coccidioides posadasii RMSCC 3488]
MYLFEGSIRQATDLWTKKMRHTKRAFLGGPSFTRGKFLTKRPESKVQCLNAGCDFTLFLRKLDYISPRGIAHVSEREAPTYDSLEVGLWRQSSRHLQTLGRFGSRLGSEIEDKSNRALTQK